LKKIIKFMYKILKHLCVRTMIHVKLLTMYIFINEYQVWLIRLFIGTQERICSWLIMYMICYIFVKTDWIFVVKENDRYGERRAVKGVVVYFITIYSILMKILVMVSTRFYFKMYAVLFIGHRSMLGEFSFREEIIINQIM
jgi:hypothetical protein